MDEVSPSEWARPEPEQPHDHKGHSEERCIRCGWVMGGRPLNCVNDDSPHRFPSQIAETEQLRAALADRIDYQAVANIVASVKDVLDAALRLHDTQLLQADTVRLQEAEIEQLRAENDALRVANHDAMWNDTLIPIADALGVSLEDEHGVQRRQFQMVDAIIKEARRG